MPRSESKPSDVKVIPMKKRTYRKISVTEVEVESLIAELGAGRVVFAIDVAEVDMVAASNSGRSRPKRERHRRRVLVDSHSVLEPLARCVTNATRRAFVRRPELTAPLPLEHATTGAIRRQHAPDQAPARALHATNSDCSAVTHHREPKLYP